MGNQRASICCTTSGGNSVENVCAETKELYEEKKGEEEPFKREPKEELKVDPYEEILLTGEPHGEEEPWEEDSIGEEHSEGDLDEDPNDEPDEECPSQLYKSQPSSDVDNINRVSSFQPSSGSEEHSEEDLYEDHNDEPDEEDPSQSYKSQPSSDNENSDRLVSFQPSSGCEEHPEEFVSEDPNDEPDEEDPSQLYKSQPSSDNENNDRVYNFEPSSASENSENSRQGLVHTSSEKKKRPRNVELNFFQKRHKKELSPSSNQLDKAVDVDVVTQAQDGTDSSGKKRHRGWDLRPRADGEVGDDDILLAKKQKTGWASEEIQLRMLGPLKLPDLLEPVTCVDPEVQKLNTQLLSVKRKLQSGDIADACLEGAMSPSPPPIYDESGFHINSKEVRLQLTKKRQSIISEIVQRNPTFQPPLDYQPPKFFKKLYIPVKEYPSYNFIGLIIGPRGNTQKRMEKETGAQILVRGRGLERKALQKKDVKPDPSKDEDLHVLVQADSQRSLDAAVSMVEKLLVPVEERYNEHRLGQLRELAKLKGTQGETGISLVGNSVEGICSACSDVIYPPSACELAVPIAGSKIDSKQSSIHSEPEDGPSHIDATHSIPSMNVTSIATSSVFPSNNITPTKAYDEANLYVGFLPLYMGEDMLIDLFSPFGRICEARVVKDRITGVNRGFGFVRYTNAANAAMAIEHMHGFLIDGNALTVRIAGIRQFSGGANIFVGYLPPHVNENKLIELFSPFGSICEAKVVTDRYTSLSKGSGFVRYTDAASASNAIAKMNGYMIDGKLLAVRIAGIPPAAANANNATVALPSYSCVPVYPDPEVIGPGTHSPAGWPASATLLNYGSMQSSTSRAYSCQTPGLASVYLGNFSN